MASRLAPSISPDTEFFWSGLKDHELRIQRCADCQTLRVPPRPMCGNCQSLQVGLRRIGGRGTVYSFVMPKYPPLPFIQYPYVVALIELDEGVRIVSNLCDIEPEAIENGMPVEVVLRKIRSPTQRRRTGAAPVPTRPLTDGTTNTWTSPSPKNKRPSARSHGNSSNIARPPNISPSSSPAENRFDAALWSELASSDLLGIALPESVGGSGGGFLELGVLLAEVGRSVAPVPLYATLVLGADTIARHGDSALREKYLSGVVDGSTILTAGAVGAGQFRSHLATDHRASERRRLAARGHQGVGTRRATGQRHRRLRSHR